MKKLKTMTHLDRTPTPASYIFKLVKPKKKFSNNQAKLTTITAPNTFQ